MTQKLCQHLYKKGVWSEKICEANCSKAKQFKCNFLEQRILDEANGEPAGFVDTVKFPLHPDNGRR